MKIMSWKDGDIILLVLLLDPSNVNALSDMRIVKFCLHLFYRADKMDKTSTETHNPLWYIWDKLDSIYHAPYYTHYYLLLDQALFKILSSWLLDLTCALYPSLFLHPQIKTHSSINHPILTTYIDNLFHLQTFATFINQLSHSSYLRYFYLHA